MTTLVIKIELSFKCIQLVKSYKILETNLLKNFYIESNENMLVLKHIFMYIMITVNYNKI